MEWPRLSVVLPNYNHGRFLPNCLNALLRQSVPPFEVIAIDDASTDNSVEILRSFEKEFPNLRVLQNEKNRGALETANRGLELVKGDYIFLPSADDEIVPGLFEKSLRMLGQYPEAALSVTISEWREGPLTWYMGAGMADRPCYLSPADLVQLGRKGKLLIVSHSAIFKKDPLFKSGGFPRDLGWHADWHATYVPGFRHGLCYIPEVLSIANMQPQSFYHSGIKKEQHQRILLRLLELFGTPAYDDVRPRIRDSGALSLFATPMFKILLTHPEYRSYLNATYLRRMAWRNLELAGKKILPGWAKQMVVRRLYGRGKK